ncbi:MAG TPA: serine/threonine-protein kinase [Kofleriaceae bacterium]|nr:serine/threonine-protein kinase [Kofleriaceae bacterium]
MDSIDDADTLAADAPMGAPLPKRSLAARYVVGGVLGRGGMGEVSAARDLDVGRDVAVKRMRNATPSGDGTGADVARFVREARIQGRLDHPAIVPVIDLGTDDDGQPYFTMKRLAGTTLAELLARDDAAQQRPRMLRAFADVCLAIEFAHARGVVHRDLKPANVVLGEYGEVYVLDWGVAKIVGEEEGGVGDGVISLDGMTQAGAVLGTPGYMPPEQVQGDADIDARADVYALGCVLFEILAGEPLHPRGAAAFATTLAGASDPRPTARGAWVPPELEAACVRACASDRGARFASARELADAVQRYLDGDRDLQRRRELAREHVIAAEDALAKAHDAAARALAMKEAGRALALDPTGEAAARIVTRLMLDPPAETPPEVTRELEALDRAQMQRQGKLAVLALGSYALFIPILIWFGVESWGWVAATYGAVAISAAMMWWLSDRVTHMTLGHAALAIFFNTLVFVFASRFLGPYLIVPALATGAIAASASFPLFWRHYNGLWLAFLIAIVAPTLLEELGVWSRTTSFDGDALTIRSPILAIDHRLVLLLVGYMAISMYACGRVVRAITLAGRDAQRRLHVHAWHLRQLVP